MQADPAAFAAGSDAAATAAAWRSRCAPAFRTQSKRPLHPGPFVSADRRRGRPRLREDGRGLCPGGSAACERSHQRPDPASQLHADGGPRDEGESPSSRRPTPMSEGWRSLYDRLLRLVLQSGARGSGRRGHSGTMRRASLARCSSSGRRGRPRKTSRRLSATPTCSWTKLRTWSASGPNGSSPSSIASRRRSAGPSSWTPHRRSTTGPRRERGGEGAIGLRGPPWSETRCVLDCRPLKTFHRTANAPRPRSPRYCTGIVPQGRTPRFPRISGASCYMLRTAVERRGRSMISLRGSRLIGGGLYPSAIRN